MKILLYIIYYCMKKKFSNIFYCVSQKKVIQVWLNMKVSDGKCQYFKDLIVLLYSANDTFF